MAPYLGQAKARDKNTCEQTDPLPSYNYVILGKCETGALLLIYG